MYRKAITFIFLFLSAFTFTRAQEAPDFSIDDTDGNTLSLYSSLNQGNIVIVKFFTTWCSICNATAPQVQNLWEGYEASQHDILFWGIDRDNSESEQQVINYANNHGITYPEAAMGGSVASLYGVTYQPDYRIVCPDKTYYTTTNWNQVDSKVQQCLIALSTNEIKNEESTLKLFPNPANNQVLLNFNLEQDAEIKVMLYNQLGQEVKNIDYGLLKGENQTLTVDIAEFSSGVYSVVLTQDGNKTAVRSLVVR